MLHAPSEPSLARGAEHPNSAALVRPEAIRNHSLGSAPLGTIESFYDALGFDVQTSKSVDPTESARLGRDERERPFMSEGVADLDVSIPVLAKAKTGGDRRRAGALGATDEAVDIVHAQLDRREA